MGKFPAHFDYFRVLNFEPTRCILGKYESQIVQRGVACPSRWGMGAHGYTWEEAANMVLQGNGNWYNTRFYRVEWTHLRLSVWKTQYHQTTTVHNWHDWSWTLLISVASGFIRDMVLKNVLAIRLFVGWMVESLPAQIHDYSKVYVKTSLLKETCKGLLGHGSKNQ